MANVRIKKLIKTYCPQSKRQFELPDTNCRPEPSHLRGIYCPKCYQVRNHKHRQDDSDSGHMHHPRPHTMTDAGSADGNCTAQEPAKDPSSTFSAIEEMIMDSYPLCKEIGLNLCVDKDQPKEKLDPHVLTHGVMWEVGCFTKKFCGTKHKIINDILQHNFNIGMQGQDVNPAFQFHLVMRHSECLRSWLNEVFVIQRLSYKRYVSQMKRAAMCKSELKETIKKRKLALQTQEKTPKTNPENCYTCPLRESDLDSDKVTNSGKSGNEDHLQNPKSCSLRSDISRESEASCLGVRAPFLTTRDTSSSLPSLKHNLDLDLQRGDSDHARSIVGRIPAIPEKRNVIKPITFSGFLCSKKQSSTNVDWKIGRSELSVRRFPICIEIGLDLDVTSKSRERKKLDLQQLTRAVVFEIHKFAIEKTGCYLPNSVYDILDYNFDISSQHHRSWEFSIATASKVKSMVKEYLKYRNDPDEVFQLPFVFAKKKRDGYSSEAPGKKTNQGNVVRQARYHSDESRVHSLDGAKITEKTLFHEDPEFPTDPGNDLVDVGCGSPLQGNLQIKEEKYDPRYGNMSPEPDTEEQCCPLHDDVKTESHIAEIEYIVPGEQTGPLGYTFLKSDHENLQCLPAEPQGSAVCPNTESTIKTEWDTEAVYLVPVAVCLGYSMGTTGQGNESPLIKEEQENVPPLIKEEQENVPPLIKEEHENVPVD